MKRGRESSRKRIDGRENRRRKKRNLLKILLFFIAIAVIPFTASLVHNIPRLFGSYSTVSTNMFWAICGFVLFLILFTAFGAPVKSYILEHELSHMVFALLSGIRIRSVSFKSSNAYVKTDRINIFIALAPYSLPLYTVILVVLYRLIKLIAISPFMDCLFYALFGVTLSFHFIATIHYIQLDQPDMKRYGYFSSVVFITTWSIVIISIVMTFMFSDIQFILYFSSTLKETIQIYTWITDLFIRFFP